MSVKKVYIVDLARPWRPITEMECPIVDGKKFVWAENRERRHLLGASAFFMSSSACNKRKQCLEKIVGNGYLRWAQPVKYWAAFKALSDDCASKRVIVSCNR